MLEAGVADTRRDGSFRPCLHLARRLRAMQALQVRDLQSARLPLPGSVMGVGVPDASGSLPPGAVVVIGADGAPAVAPYCQQRVLLYRYPGKSRVVASEGSTKGWGWVGGVECICRSVVPHPRRNVLLCCYPG
eukprot:359034-Chlamydomonas_euryale.AAC.8